MALAARAQREQLRVHIGRSVVERIELAKSGREIAEDRHEQDRGDDERPAARANGGDFVVSDRDGGYGRQCGNMQNCARRRVGADAPTRGGAEARRREDAWARGIAERTGDGAAGGGSRGCELWRARQY